jgi:hypothetical protein
MSIKYEIGIPALVIVFKEQNEVLGKTLEGCVKSLGKGLNRVAAFETAEH